MYPQCYHKGCYSNGTLPSLFFCIPSKLLKTWPTLIARINQLVEWKVKTLTYKRKVHTHKWLKNLDLRKLWKAPGSTVVMLLFPSNLVKRYSLRVTKQTHSLHLKSKATIKAMLKLEKFQEKEQIKEVCETSLSTYIFLIYRSPLNVRLRISVMLFLFSDLQETRIYGQQKFTNKKCKKPLWV